MQGGPKRPPDHGGDTCAVSILSIFTAACQAYMWPAKVGFFFHLFFCFFLFLTNLFYLLLLFAFFTVTYNTNISYTTNTS